MADLQFREGREEDAAAIIDVFLACWRTSYRGVVPDPIIDSWDRASAGALWRGYLEPGSGHRVVVASSDNGVIGVVRWSNVGTDVTIESLYVHPDASGAGAGGRLVDYVRDAVGAAERIRLWVFEANAPARRFYERHGFMPDGRRQVEDAYGEPEIGMTAVLGADGAAG